MKKKQTQFFLLFSFTMQEARELFKNPAVADPEKVEVSVLIKCFEDFAWMGQTTCWRQKNRRYRLHSDENKKSLGPLK